MLSYPNAKINLGLNIVERRDDGFHNIETLFVPYFGAKDILEVNHSNRPKMIQYGIEYDGKPEDNLCFKAYQYMASKYGISPVEIHLYKQIPVGAGLGGGSADAAFTIATINTIFELGLTLEQMAVDASNIGSDCPFFIYNTPMLAKGRGEILTPFELDLSNYEIKVINPGIHVSTKEAYSGVTPKTPEITIESILRSEITTWREHLNNDFELSVFVSHPEIAQLKENFYKDGAIYAAMSGSGSSVFGIFEK